MINHDKSPKFITKNHQKSSKVTKNYQMSRKIIMLKIMKLDGSQLFLPQRNTSALNRTLIYLSGTMHRTLPWLCREVRNECRKVIIANQQWNVLCHNICYIRWLIISL